MDENEMKIRVFETIMNLRPQNPTDVAKLANRIIAIFKSGEK